MSITRKILCCLPALALFMSLSACSGGASSNPAGASPAGTASTSATPSSPETTSPSASPETTSPPAPDSSKKPVNRTIRDDVLGHTIVVRSIVRNFPVPDRYPAIKDSRELVLVDLQLKAGNKYRTGLGGSEFSVVTADGGANNRHTTIVAAEMTKAGYEPLSSEVDPGETGSGWVAFTVSPTDSKALKLRYKRLASQVIGSGKQIPEKTLDVVLTK